MFESEAEAAAHDMSVARGGRWSFDGGSYEDGRLFEFYATPDEEERAAISRLRWNMGAETHDEDCAHIFYVDGSASPYSLLDLDVGIARREAEFLRGTQYEGEAEGILTAVTRRREKFHLEMKAGRLMKRNNWGLAFKVIDHWDLAEPLARGGSLKEE